MTQQSPSGKVQTVLGPIDPDDLGVTVTHEHVMIDLRPYFETPDEASERGYIDRPLTMDLLGRSRRMWKYNIDNLLLLDERVATREVHEWRLAGGDSIVDATSVGIARDPLMLARVSRATGLNIVMGSSFYVPLSHPADMDDRSEEAIAEQIIGEVTNGVGDTGVRSGVIGEIGCWWPMPDNVRKVLRASAHAQTATGAPILIHPGFHDLSHDEIMDILDGAGADPTRVIMGHLDSTRNDMGALKALADRGCLMEYDTFGNEDTSWNPLSALEPVNDVQRIERIEFLIENGHLDKVVMAHDVCVKRQLKERGGKGYSHILESIVPRLRRRGWTDEQLQAVLVDNPKRALTFR